MLLHESPAFLPPHTAQGAGALAHAVDDTTTTMRLAKKTRISRWYRD